MLARNPVSGADNYPIFAQSSGNMLRWLESTKR